MDIGAFAAAVVAYCGVTHASVNSWVRTRRHNMDVGGVPYSYHQVGLGADVIYDDPAPEKTWRVSIANKLGLRCIVEGDHDHLEPKK